MTRIPHIYKKNVRMEGMIGYRLDTLQYTLIMYSYRVHTVNLYLDIYCVNTSSLLIGTHYIDR